MTASRAWNGLLLLSTAVAAFSGLLFGFDTAVIAGTTRAITSVFRLTPGSLGVTVSCAIWGTVVGSLAVAPLAERYGSRESLRVIALLYLASAVSCAFAPSWPAFLAARFTGGLAIGGCSVVSPMYIAEIAPPRLRGRMVASFQLSIVTGILVAYLSNHLLEMFVSGPNLWRFQLGAVALPAAAFTLALFLIPRSPHWLVKQGRLHEAARMLRRLGSPDAQDAVAEIRRAIHRDGEDSADSIFERRFRKPLLLALALGLFNQLTGVNAVLYYLNDIFTLAGFSAFSAGKQATLVGVANLLFTIVGLSLVDLLGRRPLLLWGAAGMAGSLAGVAAVLSSHGSTALLLPLLLVYIACFAATQGTVVWVYLSEIFPEAVRERGQALASFWLWLLAAGVSGLFPSLAAHHRSLPFGLFSAAMLCQFIVVQQLFPETNGRLLQAS